MLLVPEQDRLHSVETRLERAEVTSETVGAVLADAAVASRERGPALTWALEPVVVDAFRDAVHKQPTLVTDVVAPAIGPAVRRAVAAALKELLERFNTALERSLSVESIRWRLEARRTGRPFAEVVLLHTLLYRVEQVLLIHRETGLVLQHLVAADVTAQDPDQVAAMLSAIESFVHDAFRERAWLDRFEIGELAGLVQHGPRTVLVAIVRGTPPASLATQLERTNERIALELGEPLAHFDGDPTPFAAARPMLEACLAARADRPHRPSLVTRIAPAALLVALVALLAATIAPRVHAARARARDLSALTEALGHEPGVVLTSATQLRGGRVRLAGLRDPLARDPGALLRRRGVPRARAELHFEPFYSLDPRLRARRAAAVLRPPPTVTLQLAPGPGGSIRATGIAPRRWIETAPLLAAATPGLGELDVRQVRAEREPQALAAQLARVPVGFARGRASPEPEQSAQLDAIARDIIALAELARSAGLEPRIELVGSADPTGRADENEALGAARARSVAEALRARGVPAAMVSARPAGVVAVGGGPAACAARETSTVAQARCEAVWAAARRVALHVELVPAADETPRPR